MVSFKENIMIEQQANFLQNGYQQHDTRIHQSRLTAAHKIKRSLSHRRKLVKKIPLIKKEIETESSVKLSTEKLIQSIIDCNLINLRQSLDNGKVDFKSSSYNP